MILLIGFGFGCSDPNHYDNTRIHHIKSFDPSIEIHTLDNFQCDTSDMHHMINFNDTQLVHEQLGDYKYDLIFVDFSTIKFVHKFIDFFELFTDHLEIGGSMFMEYIGSDDRFIHKRTPISYIPNLILEYSDHLDSIYAASMYPVSNDDRPIYRSSIYKIDDLIKRYPNFTFTRGAQIPYNLRNPHDGKGSYISITRNY